MEFKHYLAILWKRKWVLLQIFVAAAVIASVWMFFAKPVFESSSLLYIEGSNSNIEVQIDLLKDVPIVNEVIKKLDIRDNNGQLISRDDLLKKVRIRPAQEADTIRITAFSQDPEESSNIANAIARQYVFWRQQTKISRSREQGRSILDQAEIYKKKIEKLEKYKAGLDKKRSSARKKVELAKAVSTIKKVQRKYNVLVKQSGTIRTTEATSIKEIRLVSLAGIPKETENPKRSIYVVFWTVIGLIVGSSVVFLLEYLDDRIKSSEEKEHKKI